MSHSITAHSIVAMMLVASAACGRFGFEPQPLSTTDAGLEPDAPIEPDAALTTVVLFGTELVDDDSFSVSEPEENCGLCDSLNGGESEASLIRFDVSRIDSSVVIQSVVLELWLRTPFTPGGETDIFVLNEDWTEGDQAGAPGIPNWNTREAGSMWLSPGVEDDSRGRLLASFEPISLEIPSQIELPTDLVTEWITTPSENYGIVMEGRDYPGGGGDHPHFFSSEHDPATRGPSLTIMYSPSE